MISIHRDFLSFKKNYFFSGAGAGAGAGLTSSLPFLQHEPPFLQAEAHSFLSPVAGLVPPPLFAKVAKANEQANKDNTIDFFILN